MRLLLVEDNHSIARNVQDVLTAEASAVDVCYDGEDGLNSALNDDHDLIILDRMLPGGMDGMAARRSKFSRVTYVLRPSDWRELSRLPSSMPLLAWASKFF